METNLKGDYQTAIEYFQPVLNRDRLETCPTKMSQEKFKNITTFVFDIDGVMTDGSVHVLETGEHYRVFHIRDGYAIERAVQAGYRICVITGGKHEGVRKRLQNLKIHDVFMGSGGKSKLEIYKGWLAESGVAEEHILYMGDDLPDYEVMSRPDLFATCPADSCDEILEIANYISPKNGGKGAVRDVIEQVMRGKGEWLKFF
ncbi:HAD-IA family hydrolase [Arcicella sp. LKC2W]|uniref:KdsC family phosphatase n=1 Tax=Arcicella sp. LKC2W TaxID=2984198 RepID=UPI002B1EA346|nr:HAD-IA family hydrolase [Arcicella sp. LKC2W]MEA5459552.1 HAD-IA family hydrolase [Arcicella sp. LKC2W]